MSSDIQLHNASAKSYIIGFFLSIIFTIIPYVAVSNKLASNIILIAIIIVSGFVQLLVQLIFFLHLDFSLKQRNNLLSFVFTTLVMVIMVCGSLWIMWNMNYNMMENI